MKMNCRGCDHWTEVDRMGVGYCHITQICIGFDPDVFDECQGMVVQDKHNLPVPEHEKAIVPHDFLCKGFKQGEFSLEQFMSDNLG